LNASDWVPFFKTIHSPHSPFPWQTRLVERLCATNKWPGVLDLATGAGKTTCIDIALFHWLVCASEGRPQDAARRIAFVVDRRIIVDEAADRARKIAKAIATAKEGILVEARAILEKHAGDEARKLFEPSDDARAKRAPHSDQAAISVFALRGGVARERNLVRDPLRVSIVLSTVDQIGSRLLFRGYGVTDGMRPIHAGVFGTDTLLLLDEAHIAEPFRQTLEGIVREQARASKHVGPKPLRWVQLSATPSDKEQKEETFSLDQTDYEDRWLSPRLRALKPLRMIEVAKRDELPAKLIDLTVDELKEAPLSETEQPRIGIIVNRIATARAVHRGLLKALKGAAEVALLIGRVRPLDRDGYLSELSRKLKSSSKPRPGDKPIVLVATQTIEVGADYDFHSLFVEAASYASIKQRIGRLNRLGDRDKVRGAIVLVQADATDDPIYKNTIAATWQLLDKHATEKTVDLGISAAPAATKDVQLSSPATPYLSPSLLSLLVQTSPEPAVEPDVAEFLHGFNQEVPDVSIVWRDGLVDATDRIDDEHAAAVLRLLPPLSREAMSLPFSSFRQWVSGWDAKKAPKVVDGGDIEGSEPEPDDRARDIPYVLLIKSRTTELVRADKVRPGGMVVVPSRRGGVDECGWNPEGTEPVSDLALAARDPSLRGDEISQARRQRRLVWTPMIAASWLLAEAPSNETPSSGAAPASNPESSDTTSLEPSSRKLNASSSAVTASSPLHDVLADPDATLADARVALNAWLDEHDDRLPPDVRATAQKLRSGDSRIEWLRFKATGDRLGVVLREKRPTAEDLVEGESLQRTVRVALDDHLSKVGALAEAYAKGAGLSEPLAKALGVAGIVHDLGKADPRFQRRLCAKPGELLAKSDEYDQSVPRGERHEAYSVALLDRHPELIDGVEEHRDLIRYLVGSHHGYGRGLQPITEDHGIVFDAKVVEKRLSFEGRPGLDALGSDWADLFVSQNRAYGPWMLAYLESILRLADHRRSDQEVEEAVGQEKAEREKQKREQKAENEMAKETVE
jgi:CRISPR-associated endonuclease/helicase Cas3